MDTVMKPVQNGRGRRRQWSREQNTDGVAGVAGWGAVGRDLPEVCGERGAEVSLEAPPRPRAQRLGQGGAEESRGRATEAGRRTRTSRGTEGLGGGRVQTNLRAQGAYYITRGDVRGLPRTTGGSVAMVCRVLGQPRRWRYDRRRSRRGRPLRRPELKESVRHLLGASPPPTATGGSLHGSSDAGWRAIPKRGGEYCGDGEALDQSEPHHPVWAATRRARARIRT